MLAMQNPFWRKWLICGELQDWMGDYAIDALNLGCLFLVAAGCSTEAFHGIPGNLTRAAALALRAARRLPGSLFAFGDLRCASVRSTRLTNLARMAKGPAEPVGGMRRFCR
jgi:hypothetical protein